MKLPNTLKTQGVILVDQIRAVDCQARNAKIIENVPAQIMIEVLARLEPLVRL